MMKKVFILVLTFLSLLLPQTARAQQLEHIQQYDTTVVIRKDGSIGVTERIDYFFSSPRHGIYRNIPVIKTNTDGKRFKMTLTDISVTDEQGIAYAFTDSKDGDNEVFKIGDAGKTLSGSHWYVLTYTVLGALTHFPGHDELYWNSVGTQWPVPVAKSKITVTLPQSIARTDLNATCFVGVKGATGKDCTISVTDDSVTVNVGRQLEANEGETVVVGFPKGIVGVLEPKELVPFFTTQLGKILLVFLGLAALLWYVITPILVIRTWWKTGRDPKPMMGEVSAWFSPPKTRKLRDLTPAETGTLVDESADLSDIYATLVDLARRGYMKIIEIKKGVFDFEKQKDWKKDTGIQPFEGKLLRAVFESDDRVSLADLDLHDTFESVKKQLYTSLVSDGFFPENPQKVRGMYYVLAGFAFFTGNLFLFLAALIFGKNMPRKTPYGVQQAMIAKSLKNFLVSQDRKLSFQAKNQMMFEKLLPYAVAFGVEEIWAARFKDLSLKQPDWYESTTGGSFNTVLFTQNIGRAASVSFASSVTAKSSSGFSSGFSGGGSSGGGGGGGGGGSW